MWLAGSDDGISKVKDPIVAIVRWIKSRSSREKTYLGGLAAFVVSHKHLVLKRASLCIMSFGQTK